MTDWRFYGRAKEIANLRNGLEFDTVPSTRRFHALKVRGRRGVGKTELLEYLSRRAPPETTFVLYELPDPATEGTPVAAVVQGLIVAARQAGLTNKNAMPAQQDWPNAYLWFKAYVLGLLQIGAVVVLDEFHLARDWGLDSYVKQIIDEASGGRGQWGKLYPGKLVLMGSHQQRIDEMFRADKPLYGRTGTTVNVRPWCLKTIMTMAAEQGVLATPGRFLTLWTAYDGMPRNWQRYCTGPDYRHLHEIKDDTEWRKAWLEVEYRIVTADQRERWDTKAWIELPPDQRELLVWIGHNRPKGMELNKVPKELGSHDKKLAIMNHLRTWLDLVDLNRPLGEQSPAKWYITDPNTLFQINVFREMVHIKDDQPAVSVTGTMLKKREDKRHLTRMETLEGGALELLAGAWLAAKEGVTWTSTRAWHPDFDGDIDAIATSMGDGPKIVWLGSCKRSERSHSPDNARNEQDRFMECLLASAGREKEESAELLKNAELKRLLFSPTFSPEFHEAFGQEGFTTIDIPAMARSFNLEHAPHQEAHQIKSDHEARPPVPDKDVVLKKQKNSAPPRTGI